MKKFQKRIAVLLCAMLLMSISATAFAAENDPIFVPTGPGVEYQSGPSQPIPQVQKEFGSFSGMIKQLNESATQKGTLIARVENADDSIADVIISPKTVRATDGKIAVSAQIVAFYDATAPMLMIYPPQYNAKVVAVLGEGQSITVDRFDKNMLSSDGSLKLNITKETKIVSESGKTFSGSLANRMLVVLYGIVLETYPMQTAPEKVIVLNEKPADTVGNVSKKPIVVNGKVIKVPKAYLNKQGVVMVPLNAIAKALGMKVVRNAGNGPSTITYKIGVDSYKTYLQAEPIKLGTAPVWRWGVTYVPLSFFEKVVQVDYAYVTDTQIVIGN